MLVGGRRGAITLLVDWEAGDYVRGGRFVPLRHSVEWHVARTLAELGHRVTLVPFNSELAESIAAIRKSEPALVFNLTESVDGNRRLDGAIAGVLELLKLPYTGTGPAGLQLCRDKALSKRIVASHGINAPRFITAASVAEARNHGLRFPVIVKPQFGDGGDGISRASLVHGTPQLVRRVQVLLRRFHEPVICEEFVSGHDLYVSLLADGRGVVQSMPPMELVIGRKRTDGPQFATSQLRHNGAYRSRWRVRWRRAPLDASVLARVSAAAHAAFAALQLRDYGRVDFRLASDGEFYFIEANPNHDLSPHTFATNVCFAGVPYRHAIERIVAAAIRRNNPRRLHS